MGFGARLAREGRYLKGLLRTLGKVRSVKPDSPNLACDDWEAPVDKHAARTAVVAEGRSYTYAEYDALANRFAHWARDQGITRGQAVAIFLPNRAEYVAAW